MKRVIVLLALLAVTACRAGATKTLTSSAAFVDPQGNPVANGSLILRLNTAAKLISNGQVVPYLTVTVQLDATGKVSGAPVIIANDELMPTGTYFIVTVYNSNGLVVRGPEQWILSGASPIDLSGVTSVNSPDPGLGSPVLQNPSGNQTIVQPNGTTFAVQGANSFNSPITTTVTTGTAPFSIASQTLVPNLNVQFHGGFAAPASAILGLTDAQSPTNKTIDISANTLKTATNTAGHVPRNNGSQYVDSTLACGDLSNSTAGCSTPLQGSDTKLLTSGTVSGTGAALCTDANGGATTSGCTSGGVSEAIFSIGLATISGSTAVCADGSAGCPETVLANAHTLIRLTYSLTTAPVGCSTNMIVALRDITANSNISSITVNQASSGFVDSGALSAAMTAGDKFGLGVTTVATGCSTAPALVGLTAVYK